VERLAEALARSPEDKALNAAYDEALGLFAAGPGKKILILLKGMLLLIG